MSIISHTFCFSMEAFLHVHVVVVTFVCKRMRNKKHWRHLVTLFNSNRFVPFYYYYLLLEIANFIYIEKLLTKRNGKKNE